MPLLKFTCSQHQFATCFFCDRRPFLPGECDLSPYDRLSRLEQWVDKKLSQKGKSCLPHVDRKFKPMVDADENRGHIDGFNSNSSNPAGKASNEARSKLIVTCLPASLLAVRSEANERIFKYGRGSNMFGGTLVLEARKH